MKTDKRELLPSRRSENKNFAEDVGLETTQFVVILLILRDNVEFTFNSDFERHY